MKGDKKKIGKKRRGVQTATKKADKKLKVGSKEWHKDQIKKYQKVQPIYEIYSNTLRKVLEKSKKLYAPMAIVQARAKTLSSFAEKAARKAYKYDSPVNQITDLAGARIITHTRSQALSLCKFIKDNFEIDEDNSIDVRSKLRTTEFGYLAYHYIVMPSSNRILGVTVPQSVRGLGNNKAEIQVRTLLQHAWADISHDRIYKSPIKVPDEWVRESARLAALLENADDDFARMAEASHFYTSNYGALMNVEEAAHEIEILSTVLENEPEKEARPKHALRLSRIYKSSGDWQRIIDTLSRFVAHKNPWQAAIQMELGYAYCQRYKRDPKSEDYLKGQALLKRVAQPVDDPETIIEGSSTALAENESWKIRSEALYLLAASYRELKGMEKYTRDLYYQAYLLDPTNPCHLASFLEYEIDFRHDNSFLRLMRPTIIEAVDACRRRIRARVEVPWTYLAMGRLWLLIDEPYKSLNAYTKAVDLCIAGGTCVPDDFFTAEMDSLKRLNLGRDLPKNLRYVETLLLLAEVVKNKGRLAKQRLKGGAIRKEKSRLPVLVVAGGADRMIDKHQKMYKSFLKGAFWSYMGTVISGGTTSGIPGLVGSVVKAARRGEGTKECDLIGYIPHLLPANVTKDSRNYDELVETSGEGFTPLEPLQYWVDLVAKGVKPNKVRLLGINGGDIVGFEFRLALALGAAVGLLKSSGRAASERSEDEDWNDHPRLLVLPQDRMTIWAFVNQLVKPLLKKSQVEKAAKSVHHEYVEKKRKQAKLTDPALMTWKELRDDIKNSNRQQVAYMEKILGRVGYDVRKAKGEKEIAYPEFNSEEVDRMAEMEHGRWIVERFLSGWKYGPKKDTAKKISPYLKPWREIPLDVQKWDRDAVCNFPVILKEAGFEVYKLKKVKRSKKQGTL